ncbi:MAG: hypothetical protein NVSMB25_22740 [Thermoleophilaceae bacterium]
MSLGLIVRRVSVLLTLALSIVFATAVLLERSGPVAGLEIVAVALVALVATRLVAFTTGALGWSLLPRAHRELLARISQESRSAAPADKLASVE